MVHFNKLSEDQHQRLLGYGIQPVPKSVIKDAEASYVRFGLDKAKDTNPVVELPLPDFMGTWEECVNDAVSLFGTSYLERLEKLHRLITPAMPSVRPGYIKGWQHWDGAKWHSVGKPEADCAILDFETVLIDGYWYPFCAALMAKDGSLYLWCADMTKGKWVAGEWVTAYDRTLDSLPQGCMYANHNTPYDRQYIAQEYLLEDSGNRFFDTMAAFIACRGLSNQQRVAYKAMTKEDNDYLTPWAMETSTNGLDAVHKFYTGQSIDKGIRDQMVDGGLPWMLDNALDVIWYCLEDVIHTHTVFKYVYAELRQAQPHPASWTGQLLLGSSWLPLSADRYPGYYDRCESVYSEEMDKITSALLQVAALQASTPAASIEADPWLSQLDWTEGKLELTPGIMAVLMSVSDDKLTRFSSAIVQSKSSPKRWLKAPLWFRNFVKEPTIRKHCVPLMLRAKYLGKPVKWQPTGERDKRGSEVYGWATDDGWLPHPEKKGQRVTTLFSKGYVSLWENEALESDLEGMKDLVSSLVSTINWVSFRERAKSIHTEAPEGYPVVLPQLTVTGTITRRAADNVFQVMANPKPKRIGTEFKSLVEAIPGYALVGADVASQEAWICGLFGDAAIGYNGSTPFGYMNLVGTKADRTEIHTLFADLLNMQRDQVKVVNYGVIYGMSVTGATNAIQKSLPKADPAECKAKAEKHIALFKGTRSQYSGAWLGGLASYSFNWMEKLAYSRNARTPVLGASLSLALSTTGKDYGTTKVNWTVQSSGVDFRDLLILLTVYFFRKLGVRGRFLMTIHDEIRTMVHEADIKLAAYALQLAHLCVRAAFIDKLGLDCIPQGIAYFPEIDVDRYLRKEPTLDCVTPSQPEPLPHGYHLRPADLLDVAI